MSKDYLPLHVNPFRFAENATTLHGHMLLKNMQRLLPSLSLDAGDVEVKLEFGVDSEKFRFVKADIEAPIVLQCQRCLEPFSYTINSHFVSGLVGSEEAAQDLPDYYDPLVVADNTLILQDMIEEELIISLPIVPMHDPKDCKTRLPIIIADTSQGEDAVKENPFKVIESLKIKPKQE